MKKLTDNFYLKNLGLFFNVILWNFLLQKVKPKSRTRAQPTKKGITQKYKLKRKNRRKTF